MLDGLTRGWSASAVDFGKDEVSAHVAECSGMDTYMDPGLVESAARNNAGWCDTICRLHGIVGEFGADAWTSATRTPTHYPDAVTLRRSVDPGSLLDGLDSSAGCSVKDCFADLDLGSWGFDTLFEALWLVRHRDPGVPPRSPAQWSPVRDQATLTSWELARGSGGAEGAAFPPGLLASPGLVVLAAIVDESIVGGAVLNRGAGVASLANLFAPGLDLADAFSGAAAAAGRLHPGIPLVGYETGEFLDGAERAGFEPFGSLTVWIRS